jgi:hypothetical protein
MQIENGKEAQTNRSRRIASTCPAAASIKDNVLAESITAGQVSHIVCIAV